PDSRERYLRGSRDIRTFAHQRPEIILGYFQKTFGLGELLTVTVRNDPPDAGDVQVNSITPQHYPWSGRYFENMLVTITAKPREGFEFLRWTDPALGRNPKVSLEVGQVAELVAVYGRRSGNKR
ncbi:MAG: hypothetical protein OEN01_16010, partial [Candidatus Krumholzibacteria bacterium]|nr:hypothetical protein [Candidatus Krumholzibacteria bacterium]